MAALEGSIQVLSKTAAQFTTDDDILLVGQPGFETDTNKLKIGDGVTTWAALAYIGGAGDVTLNGVQTLTNKRVTPRIDTIASSATPTPNIDTTDQYNITALAAGATFGAPTGTPTDGQKLIIRVKDNGTARALSFNAVYRFSSDLASPTTTVISKTLYLGFIYNSADSKWDLIALLNNI